MGTSVKLSAVQATAVRHPGHVALVACPGSGKTRTLVAKVFDTLGEVRGTTRLIGCITYTNAAVNEIQARLAHSAMDAAALCEVETIHSFCLKHIVAPHAWRLTEFAGGFGVLPPEDPRFIDLVGRVVKHFKLPGRAAQAFEQLGRGTGVLPNDVTREAAEAFWAELDRQQLMDFSSLIYWATELVRTVPYIARGLASRYQWMLVDEFQDTSALQVEILRAIHHYGRTRFFIVGDPLQSIMGFAGGRADLLTEFGRDIAARDDLQLLDNHRSSRNVVSLAESLCPRQPQMVAAGGNRDYDHVPVWHEVATMVDGVADVFIPEVRRRGIDFAEVAVLANRWTSLLPLARGLRERQIPSLGPGARPYRRSSHVVAPLVEEVAAHIADARLRGIGRVRREVTRLVQTVTKARSGDLGFAGDVLAAELVRAARASAASDASASVFLEAFARDVAVRLDSAGVVSADERAAIERSGGAMVADIAFHEAAHGARPTTVRDLGLFARGSNSVRLLTMHGSKGREFEAVALIDVFDGHVPHFSAQPGDGTEAEGRRLLYVAITRARKLLMVFTLADPSKYTRPSRFLMSLFPGGPVDVPA